MTTEKAQKLISDLGSIGWDPGLTPESYEHIAEAGFRGENAVKAAVIAELAVECQPITLRGLFYRCVSCGLYPDTGEKHYNSVKRLTGQMRKIGIMPYTWLVDSLRTTEKPLSWSGLQDFAETVRGAYRKDFWSQLDWYVHIISEKDAIAGTIAPVTREYDVALSPIRGNTSHSFAYSLGSLFAEIEKPIFIGYLGDFDPNGMDIERDLRTKIEDHSGRQVLESDSSDLGWSSYIKRMVLDSGGGAIAWQRLAISQSDINEFDLIPLQPKKSDPRYRKFIEQHGSQAVEVDALPPQELRKRVTEAIEQFIPQAEWERLKHVEQLEQETFNAALANLGPVSTEGTH